MLKISNLKRDKKTLEDILDGPDDLGLLIVKAKTYHAQHSVVISNFQEVISFIEKNDRLPESENNFEERLLARRLKACIDNTDSYDILRPYDKFNLLPELKPLEVDTFKSNEQSSVEEIENATSLDDIFNSAAFAQLEQGDESIFNLVNVSPSTSRTSPDEVAQFKQCKDFYQFESIFTEAHKDLKSGKLKTIRFNASDIAEGDMFIMEGVLCLIDEIGEYREDNQGRYDPRLRVIFENGTEANHLLNSLSRRLYMDKTGRRIIKDAESIEDAFNNISHKDKRTGQIYFVTTKSKNQILKSIPNLIKIGYTESTVEERTKNAIRDRAFLESPVEILAVMECFNLNTSRFESLIHGFLYAQRLNMTLMDRHGKTYRPTEWFSVPLDTAKAVVKRIIDGSIINYRIDNTTGQLVKKERTSD